MIIAPLSLDLYIIMLSFKQGGIKYHFLRLVNMITFAKLNIAMDNKAATAWHPVRIKFIIRFYSPYIID